MLNGGVHGREQKAQRGRIRSQAPLKATAKSQVNKSRAASDRGWEVCCPWIVLQGVLRQATLVPQRTSVERQRQGPCCFRFRLQMVPSRLAGQVAGWLAMVPGLACLQKPVEQASSTIRSRVISLTARSDLPVSETRRMLPRNGRTPSFYSSLSAAPTEEARADCIHQSQRPAISRPCTQTRSVPLRCSVPVRIRLVQALDGFSTCEIGAAKMSRMEDERTNKYIVRRTKGNETRTHKD